MPLNPSPQLVYADGPSTMPSQPPKWEIRSIWKQVEAAIDAYSSGAGSIAKQTLVQLNGDLAHVADSTAWVFADSTSANNGIYRKTGASGSGSWTRILDLPFSFIIASDVGAGTPNAILATTPVPVSGSALVWMQIADTNTGSPVTVSFGDGSLKTIKTNSGNDIAAGGLVAGMVVLGVVSGFTFRLLNDQISSAIVASAEAAQAAAEAAQAAAEAAAAGVDLPPTAPDRMLVDNTAGTVRESKTFAQVRALLDIMTTGQIATAISDFSILAAAHPDASVNDTAVFTTIRSARPNEQIDLKGGIFLVDAIPPGKWTNGFWKVGNFYYPAASLLTRKLMITNGNIVRNWSQDQAHNNRGIRYSGLGAGVSHGSVDNNARLLASRDGGLNYEETTEFTVPDGSHSVWCASMGVHSNRQFAIVRTADADLVPTAVRMYHRKLYAQYKIANAFTTVAGSNVVTITFPELHGLRTGDQVYIVASGTPNGATIASGLHTVTRVSSPGTTVTIVASTNAATSGVGGLSTGTTIHTLATAWAEILFSGVQFGAAVATASGAGLPVTTQSFSGFAIDRCMTCVSGGPYGVVRISGIFGTTPAILYTPLTNAGLTEPTLCVSTAQGAAGRLWGLTRANGPATNVGFFYANTLTGTPVVMLENNFAFKFGQQNPAPIRYHEATDMLYAIAAERISSTQANGELPVYLLVAKRAEAETLGAAAFKVIVIDTVRTVPSGYSGSGLAYTASNCGVPSLDIDGGTLIGYISQEESQASGDAIGSSGRSNIKMFEIDISKPIAA